MRMKGAEEADVTLYSMMDRMRDVRLPSCGITPAFQCLCCVDKDTLVAVSTTFLYFYDGKAVDRCFPTWLVHPPLRQSHLQPTCTPCS